MGVGYDLFWTLNPKTLSPFIKAFRLRQEYDDLQAWRIGGYVRAAIGSAFGKNNKYPEKPLTHKSNEVEEMPMEVIKNKFLAHVELMNTRFKGKEVENG